MASADTGMIQPICQNCATSTTPLWRRDEMGSVLCNACGLFLKLHGTARPISLKTDVIKSRNRVKTAGQGQKRKSLFDGNGLPISQIDATAAHPNLFHDPRIPHKAPSGGSDPSDSPVSRNETPSLQHPSNIAPQHVFDGVGLSEHAFQSPTMPHLRHPSPGSMSTFNDRNLESTRAYEEISHENTSLKTRVSELEVINELYRGTLEGYQRGSAPQADMVSRSPDSDLKRALEQSQSREQELLQKVEQLEHTIAEIRGGHSPSKKPRLSNGSEYPEPPPNFHQ